jgi:hypothetical protein
VLIAIVTGSAGAAEVTLRRIDGGSALGAYRGIIEGGVVIAEAEGDRTVAFDVLSGFSFRESAVTRPPLSATVFYFSPDHWFTGSIVGTAASGVRVRTDIAGEFELPLWRLAAIRFAQAAENIEAGDAFAQALADRLRGKDVLVATGDAVRTARGALISLDAADGRFLFNEQERTFQISGIYGIVLGDPGASGPTATVVVHLVDGSSIPGEPIASGPEVVHLEMVLGQRVEIPLERIAGVTVQSASVVYLSDLEPVRAELSGMVHSPWPVRLNRSVGNEVMRLDGVEFERGIGVHSRTELEFTLGGAFQTFCATIGIDDSVRPRGSVVFRVLGDGRELFDSGSMSGAMPGREIAVDLAGVERLVLLVDYGDHMDLADHADWAAARLIKIDPVADGSEGP